MYKSYDQIEKERQERIEEAIRKKEFRLNEQKLSIEVSWAINCAIASLSESEKEKPWKQRFQLILKRYPELIDEHRIYMLDHLPATPERKLTKEDFIEIQKEAPERQAEQDRADTIPPEDNTQKEIDESLTTIPNEEIE